MTISDKLKVLYEKYKAYINYFIVGVLTTSVNFICYFGLKLITNTVTANAIAWFISVLFAFFANRKYVFDGKTSTVGGFLWQALSFFGARGLSGAFETFSMWLFVDCLRFNAKWQELLVKIVIGTIVLVFNYVLSKIFVFRKPKAIPQESE